jgi:prepilin signal peptidase PulO-like enzyme (type II secretory pathway)
VSTQENVPKNDPVWEGSAMDLWGQEHCDICGEILKPTDEVAEMYSTGVVGGSVICHAQCGLSAGYEVA